ncbi:hypothetical protein [Microbacterium sp. SLBN-111]|uniref:hypothetical protein n=1 Tax=Microbacterium sp. SLBN-111 TaxID=3377733 RepID=UPI003C722E9C
MKLKRFAALGTALGVALAGIGAATAAHADPVSDGYSIVGSDTLQDAVAALANGTSITNSSVKVTGAGKALASWDAFTLGVSGGVGKIQTKPFGKIFDRPNGSGAGRKALLASIGGLDGLSFTYNGVDVKNQVDLSRSSSKGTAVSGGVLTYVPFGQDAISFLYKVGSGSDASTAATWISDLDKNELASIYTSSSSSPVTVPGTSFVVKPLSLQASSGTWTTFLSKIGVNSSTLGSGVVGGATNTTTPENDGTVLDPAANEVQIIPVSAANYIGQSNGAARINTMNGVSLGSIGGVNPTTGSAPSLTPNATFYSGEWGRTVFIVVPTAKISSGNAAYDQGLAALTNPASSTSLTYWGASNLPSTTKAVKIKFGFGAPQDSAFTANN